MASILESISRAGRMLFGAVVYPDKEYTLNNPEKAQAIRKVAEGLKVGKNEPVNFAGSLIAELIKQKTGLEAPVLVPIPSSTGDTSSNRRLCEAILSHFPEGDIEDLLSSYPSKSSLKARRSGLPGKSVSDIDTFLKTFSEDKGKYILIDNVITTGSTVYAAQNAMKEKYGKPPAFAFAISEDPKKIGQEEFSRIRELSGVY